MRTWPGSGGRKEHLLFLGCRLECPTGVLRGHIAFHGGHASLDSLLPLRAALGPLEELLGGTLYMADPEANARSVSPNVDRRVEPVECHQGTLMEVGNVWYRFF